MTALPKRPKWTILYNFIPPNSAWVCTAWEFYDDDQIAQTRYDALNAEPETSATKRPFFEKPDRLHLGACHHGGA
jgi:hypothetical protein